MRTEEIGRANPETVKALLEHLLTAFNEFCDRQPDGVPFIDAFMAAHNFHAYIVLDIEKWVKANAEQQLFWRKVAADTFTMAMERKPAFTQEEPNDPQTT